jgi:hypothetical protein
MVGSSNASPGASGNDCSKFWETLHIDLRMVDTSDFTIAYCPTNIYSVGTPHDIALCRQQRKPVLFVSPPVTFPALDQLRRRLAGDPVALKLLDQLEAEVPIKPNPRGIPSSWYMPLVGGDHFFDSFGFHRYREQFGWAESPLDEQEQGRKLENPLLPFLEKLNHDLPKKWNHRMRKYVPNDDWLLWDLQRVERPNPRRIMNTEDDPALGQEGERICRLCPAAAGALERCAKVLPRR